jgi:hypothetical protein
MEMLLDFSTMMIEELMGRLKAVDVCEVEGSMSTRSITLEIEEFKLAKPKSIIGSFYSSAFYVSNGAEVAFTKDFYYASVLLQG